VDTLRAAAPFQRLRGAEPGRLALRSEDIRLRRFREKAETCAIFLVDASGSAAAERLAEAKGAVERLLADAYVTRTDVALVAFRGRGADLLLPPTRSLTRAKRALAGLPGGGGTPLAAALQQGLALALAQKAKGRSVQLVAMTDGRANIARDGSEGREGAMADALLLARAVRAAGVPSAVIDISARPRPEARTLADAMGARYLPLPRRDATAVADAVRKERAA
jgi:magnesium chelatase subunit D